MITKVLPLTHTFPDIDTVKYLSAQYLTLPEYHPVFYDIETTGLSAASSYCYLIGCITFEKDTWILRQWLAESSDEEICILNAFYDFIRNYNYVIQYNGNKFDFPYLMSRCEKHHIPMYLETLPALDLYQELKVCKNLLRFDHMKQSDIECFLNLNSRIFADGKQCIKCYKDYIKKKDSDLLQEVLGHNLEDLFGLGLIFTMLNYRFLFSGDYTISRCSWDGEHYILHFTLPHPVPASFSFISEGLYLTGTNKNMKLLISASNGKLKMYYSNYKDYAYLPAEDTAIPKSLSTYIDKSLKKPAKPETCYTWFEINKCFLNNPEQQHKYLEHLLTFVLNH